MSSLVIGQKLNENNLMFLWVRYLLEEAMSGEIINKMLGGQRLLMLSTKSVQ